MAVPFGKYELLRKIASGGMGQVFLAREHGSGFERLVVLKLILPHLAEDDEFLNMFLEEAGLVAQLTHPNLITILDLSEIEGRHCLAMEYVQGDDVRRLDKFSRTQGRPMPTGLVLRVMADAAAGLYYAHQARDAQGQPLRLVHRDVSPQNVLVGFDGGVKVIDFGVAKAATSSAHTATGVLKGKYPYMSPEQAHGEHVDARSDQFALGVVMWELLTGKRLFKGETDMMTLRLVKDCQVPKPSQLNPKLPPGLDEVVLKALAPTPDGRYADCAALRLALEDYALNLRLPSSSAHLSAYLREVYAERIALESDPAKLDQLAEDADLDARSNSSISGMASSQQRSAMKGSPGTRSRRAAPGQVAGLTQKERTRNTAAMDRPHTVAGGISRGPWPTVAVVGALLVLAGVAILFFRASMGGSTTTTQPPQNPPIAVVHIEPNPKPDPPPVPAPVDLQVVSTPPGAMVSVNGEERGATPYKLPLKPGDAPVQVTLALNGYEPVTRQVSAADAPQVAVELQRQPKTGPGRKNPGTTPQGPGLGIKRGR